MSLWLHGRAALAAAAYANSSLLDPDNMTCVDIVNAYSGEERCNIVKEVCRSSPCKMQNAYSSYTCWLSDQMSAALRCPSSHANIPSSFATLAFNLDDIAAITTLRHTLVYFLFVCVGCSGAKETLKSVKTTGKRVKPCSRSSTNTLTTRTHARGGGYRATRP